VLADRTCALMPICAWNQSKQRGYPHVTNRFSGRTTSALARGPVLLLYAIVAVNHRKGETACPFSARSAGSPAVL
jgi:hypothetical protein